MDEESGKRRQDYLNRMDENYKERTKWQHRRVAVDVVLRFIAVAGAVAASVLINISQVSRVFPTVLTALIALAAGLSSYFKFGELGRNDRLTAHALQDEIEDYKLKTGRYNNLDKDKAFDLFREKTKGILNEHLAKVYAISAQKQPHQDNKGNEA